MDGADSVRRRLQAGQRCAGATSGPFSVDETWTQYQLPFASLTNGVALLDLALIMNVQFMTTGDELGDVELVIDDVMFY